LELIGRASMEKKGTKKHSGQGCQIFLGATYQNWKNYQNDHTMYQMAIKNGIAIKKFPNGHIVYRQFHFKALPNLPKF
jgi:hypothetical protein